MKKRQAKYAYLFGPTNWGHSSVYQANGRYFFIHRLNSNSLQCVPLWSDDLILEWRCQK